MPATRPCTPPSPAQDLRGSAAPPGARRGGCGPGTLHWRGPGMICSRRPGLIRWRGHGVSNWRSPRMICPRGPVVIRWRGHGVGDWRGPGMILRAPSGCDPLARSRMIRSRDPGTIRRCGHRTRWGGHVICYGGPGVIHSRERPLLPGRTAHFAVSSAHGPVRAVGSAHRRVRAWAELDIGGSGLRRCRETVCSTTITRHPAIAGKVDVELRVLSAPEIDIGRVGDGRCRVLVRAARAAPR